MCRKCLAPEVYEESTFFTSSFGNGFAMPVVHACCGNGCPGCPNFPSNIKPKENNDE